MCAPPPTLIGSLRRVLDPRPGSSRALTWAGSICPRWVEGRLPIIRTTARWKANPSGGHEVEGSAVDLLVVATPYQHDAPAREVGSLVSEEIERLSVVGDLAQSAGDLPGAQPTGLDLPRGP